MIKGKVVYKGAIKYLRKVEKQSRFAHAKALTQTAWQVKDEEVKALSRHLHKPTDFTKNAYRVQKATPAKPVAAVYTAPIQERYLSRQIHGGTLLRNRPTPTRRFKDQHGNLPRGLMKQNNKQIYHVRSRGKRYTFFRGSGGKSTLMATWTDTRRYTRRLPFYKVAYVVVNRRFKINYHKAFRAAMRTAR